MAVVIDIEPGASAEAVRRTLARTRTNRIVLNLPEEWAELDNMARMRLLQRQAQLLRKDIALVTNHGATQRAAKQVGIPVFLHPEDGIDTGWQMKPVSPLVDPRQPDAGLPDAPTWKRREILERVQKEGERRSRQQRILTERIHRRPLPLWMSWAWNIVAGALIVLFLGGFVLYVLPAATITLVPGQEVISVSVPLTADPTLATSELDDGLIVARLLETTITEEGTTNTTGTGEQASGNASGSVVFSNLSAAPVFIPAGTIVSTATGSPINFRTTSPVEVPAGVNASATVSVQAVDPGAAGNMQSNTITTVSGALQSRVRVTNPNGIGGGGQATVSVVTEADRERLVAETLALAEADAYARLEESLQEGERLPPESVQTYITGQGAPSALVDEPADELTLSINVLAQGVAVEDALVAEAALAQLRAAVPPRGQLVADTIAFQYEPDATQSGLAVQFTVTASGEYVVPIDPDEARTLIAGMTPDEAIAALQANWPLARPPEIYRDPELLPTLPNLMSRMQIRIEYQNAVAVP